VQFDHRMLAYAIWLFALAHAFDAARGVKEGRVVVNAFLLAAAVTLQAALGIWTLLMGAPIAVALVHQAMAMLVLTAATIHAANAAQRIARPIVESARA
jgi:cytochrome c oxidase assembly protein subunit 15